MTKKNSLESEDILKENIIKLEEIFPQIFTEYKVDFDKLKETLGKFLELSEERYYFSWSGRSNSLKILQKPSIGTLFPVKNESVNFADTENIFIEGENLETLKLLKKSYSGKIKMIYIDPPYNTGNDLLYKDDFKNSIQSYLEQTGQTKNGQKLTSNPETSGRFHSDYLSFIYPRLFIAREFLCEDGIIFVSIGQKELNNLITILNEIFGEENRVGVISRLMKSGSNKGEFFSPNIDYVLVYAKNINSAESFRIPLEQEYMDKTYNLEETQGDRKGELYREMGLYQASLEIRKNQRYWIKCPDGSLAIPPGKTFPSKLLEGKQIQPQKGDGVWRWIYKTYQKALTADNVIFKKTNSSSLVNEKRKKSNWNIYSKIWAKDRIEEGRVPTDLITKYENRHSSAELKVLDLPFDYAKPTKLISHLMLFFKNNDFTIMDFFAGSGSTAQSVFDLNKEDGGNRKFILCQLPEPTTNDSEAFKAGFKNISEIGKERIRRVIKNFKIENKQKKLTQEKEQDLGFKVFRLGKSNFRIWENYQGKEPNDLKKQMKLFENQLIDGSIDEDVIYECLIKEGFSLNSKIEKIDSKNLVYKVSDEGQFLYIILEKAIKENIIEKLALTKDTILICLDSALDDSKKTNLALQCNLKTI